MLCLPYYLQVCVFDVPREVVHKGWYLQGQNLLGKKLYPFFLERQQSLSKFLHVSE